ncbi:MAG: MraY family glycosyltransferase [Gammaproteobacteria bacterium]
MNGLVFLVLAVTLSVLAIPVAIRLAPRLGMVDKPDPRKVHAKPIPRIGGIGITLGALLPIAILLPWTPILESFLLGSLILFVFGAWDDSKEITHWIKFGGQFAAAGLIVYHGNLWVERFPFLGGELLPAYIGKPFTIFAIVGVINAINHSDGLDGLAGGECLLSLIVMGFLAYVASDSLAVYLTCAVAGGILGFLRFNTHPARIFMGDAGSQFIGFAMAFLAVYLTQIAHPALSPALPLLLIGLPIADINAVFYLRISGGMNWFKATRNHIHHRLLDLGFEHYETVILIYSVQAILVGSAVLLRYQSDALVTLVFFAIVTVLFISLTVAERRKWEFTATPEKRALSRVVGSLTTDRRMAKHAAAAAVAMFSVLLLIGTLAVRDVPLVVAFISFSLLVACSINLARRSGSSDSLIFRFATYSIALLVVYLTVQEPPASRWLAFGVSTPAYLVLAAITGIAIRMATEQVFRTTATDYLILFGLITISIFGRELLEVRHISLIIVHSVIMVYAAEFTCRATQKRLSLLSVAVLLSLLILSLKGL